MRRDEHLLANQSLNTSIGSECWGTWRSRKPSLSSYSAIFEFPNTVQGQTLRRDEERTRKWWVDMWRTRAANTAVFQSRITQQMHQEIEETQALSGWGHCGDLSPAQQHSAHTARAGHHGQVHIAGLRDPLDHSCSEPETPKACHQQTVRIQTDLLPVDDEEIAWLRLVGSNGRHTVQLVPNGFSPQDRRFAREFCLGEQASWRRSGKPLCSWHSWTSRTPLTTYTIPSQPHQYNRKEYQNS